MKVEKEKLKNLARPLTPDEIKEIEDRNEPWRMLAIKVAIRIRELMKIKPGANISTLANVLGYSEELTIKILNGEWKGLSLKAIAKIETYLGAPILGNGLA